MDICTKKQIVAETASTTLYILWDQRSSIFGVHLKANLMPTLMTTAALTFNATCTVAVKGRWTRQSWMREFKEYKISQLALRMNTATARLLKVRSTTLTVVGSSLDPDDLPKHELRLEIIELQKEQARLDSNHKSQLSAVDVKKRQLISDEVSIPLRKGGTVCMLSSLDCRTVTGVRTSICACSLTSYHISSTKMHRAAAPISTRVMISHGQ